MISFSNISLTQFRNYDFKKFSFQKRIIGIYGENGTGKTNLLDAIFYVCFTKSYFNRPDTKSIKNGFEGFRIEAILNDETMITCVLRENGKKEFEVNNEAYKKFSEHVGKYPCVMIAPDDVQLILGGSENRRRWLDALISQTDSEYLQTLINYNKVLQQRNGLLKNNIGNFKIDKELLDILDDQLVLFGESIFAKRKHFFDEWAAKIYQQYKTISEKEDSPEIVYSSQLQEIDSFKKQLINNREKDILLQRSNLGIHKDDILFSMDNQPFKNIASQGQRKSLLFAIRLSEYAFLKQHLHISPFLLLDDIFEKLDAKRMNNLLRFIQEQTDCQVFITDTHKDRLQNAFEQIGADYQLVELL